MTRRSMTKDGYDEKTLEEFLDLVGARSHRDLALEVWHLSATVRLLENKVHQLSDALDRANHRYKYDEMKSSYLEEFVEFCSVMDRALEMDPACVPSAEESRMRSIFAGREVPGVIIDMIAWRFFSLGASNVHDAIFCSEGSVAR